MRIISFFIVVVLAGCGIDQSGLGSTDSGTEDVQIDTRVDVLRDTPMDSSDDVQMDTTDPGDTGVDADASCVNGRTEPCAGESRGLCDPGMRTCVNGEWSGCAGVVGPSTEICDGMNDEDCDGTVDNGCSCVNDTVSSCEVNGCPGEQSCINGTLSSCTATRVPSIYYPDRDNDGYGDDMMREEHCEPPAGWISRGGDCVDSDPEINPGAQDTCDEDLNCDGVRTPDAIVTWTTVEGGSGQRYLDCGAPRRNMFELLPDNETASEYCSLFGFHVLELNSAAEQAFVEETFGQQPYWLNIRRLPPRQYEWQTAPRRAVLDGSSYGGTPSRTPWKRGEPDNEVVQTCVQVWDFEWESISCGALEPPHTICEAPPLP